MPLDAAEPMLTQLGFENVLVDESNSEMSVWDDVEREMRSEVDAALAKEMGLLPADLEAARREEAEDARLVAALAAEQQETKTHGKMREDGGKTAGKCPSFEGVLEEEWVAQEERGGFHAKDPKFAHLSALSMDDICARVVLYGVNPPAVKADDVDERHQQG